MKRYFRNRGTVALITLMIIIGALIGFVNASKIKVSFVGNVVNVIVTPIQKLITNTGNSISNFFGYFSDVDAIRNENKSLKEENAELLTQIEILKVKETENESLRSLLGLKKSLTNLETEGAQIVARDISNWFSSFTVDKGTADGIAIDQTVIANNKALVGRVYEVGSNWAKVVVITDPECSVGVYAERSREYGVTEGDAHLQKEGKLKLSYISQNTSLLVGDTLLTSGLGGVFPEGLIVGKVQNIKTDVQGISQYATVIPMCDIDRLKTVLIIKNSF